MHFFLVFYVNEYRRIETDGHWKPRVNKFSDGDLPGWPHGHSGWAEMLIEADSLTDAEEKAAQWVSEHNDEIERRSFSR
jgi:hypothetical protein